ncbi:uncharacterized protein LOC133516856 [Cydia pomonella]|uniref:uncharacterized protein LOC133516856 n=1 Tax=Cydia pomonella TaxID=82600 RepID=UPI002ADDA7BB|nr:uncharacterized protein LOC133516856 [Cydia pomonella]XP_061705854.1 uncharacterized protein LOC133516856 [Cydia pomonella]XP_061705863.1 uncharacterized protein LOC133516856 [Cydia pomonella]XP_061705871.1 uncharacterized protein LOC133516856 [Cydia pomonella]
MKLVAKINYTIYITISIIGLELFVSYNVIFIFTNMAFRFLVIRMALHYLFLLPGQGSDANFAVDATDGELYVKRLHNKENIAESPAYLLFTAPYKVCEGGCNYGNDTNFAMAFPLFVGNYGRSAYKEMYPNEQRDLNDLLSKTRSTKPPFVTCPPEKPTPNRHTKSTGYPGYSISIPQTRSTGYPGYTDTEYIDTEYGETEYINDDENNKNTPTGVQVTKSTVFPTYKSLMTRFLRKLAVRKSRDKYFPEHESFRKTQSQYLSGKSTHRVNTIPGRYGRKMQRPRSSHIWRNIPLKLLDPVQIWWTQLLPRQQTYTKTQNSEHAELKNKKHNEFLPFGIMPVLPITSEKYHGH